MDRESLKNILNRWKWGASSFLPPQKSVSPRRKSSSPSTSPSSTPTKRDRKKARAEPVTMSQRVGGASSSTTHSKSAQAEIDEFELDRLFLTANNTTIIAPPSARISALKGRSETSGGFRPTMRSKGQPNHQPDPPVDPTPIAALVTESKISTAFPVFASSHHRTRAPDDYETNDNSTPHERPVHTATANEPQNNYDDWDDLPPNPHPRPSRTVDDFFDVFGTFAPPPPEEKREPILDAVRTFPQVDPTPQTLAPQPHRPTLADLLDGAPPPPPLQPQLTPTRLFGYEATRPEQFATDVNRMSSLMDVDGETAFLPQHTVDMHVIGAARPSNSAAASFQHEAIPHQLGGNATAAAAIKELNDAFSSWSLRLGTSGADTSPSQTAYRVVDVIHEADLALGTKATETHRRFDLILELQASEPTRLPSQGASPTSGHMSNCSRASKMVLLTCSVHSIGRSLTQSVLGRGQAVIHDEDTIPRNAVLQGPTKTAAGEFYLPHGNTMVAQNSSRVLAKSQIGRLVNSHAEEEGATKEEADSAFEVTSSREFVRQCGGLLESTLITTEGAHYTTPIFQVLMSEHTFNASGLASAVQAQKAAVQGSPRMSQRSSPVAVLFGVGFPMWALHVSHSQHCCLIQASANVRVIRIKSDESGSTGRMSSGAQPPRPFRVDDPLATGDPEVRRNLFHEADLIEAAEELDPETGYALGPYSVSADDDWYVPIGVVEHIHAAYQQMLADEQS